jgi:hypothetical protein
VTAGRYDGLDLAGDICRLVVISSVPQASSEFRWGRRLEVDLHKSESHGNSLSEAPAEADGVFG